MKFSKESNPDLLDDLFKKRIDHISNQIYNNQTLLMTGSKQHYWDFSHFLKNKEDYVDFISKELETKEWLSSKFPQIQNFEINLDNVYENMMKWDIDHKVLRTVSKNRRNINVAKLRYKQNKERATD